MAVISKILQSFLLVLNQKCTKKEREKEQKRRSVLSSVLVPEKVDKMTVNVFKVLFVWYQPNKHHERSRGRKEREERNKTKTELCTMMCVKSNEERLNGGKFS